MMWKEVLQSEKIPVQLTGSNVEGASGQPYPPKALLVAGITGANLTAVHCEPNSTDGAGIRNSFWSSAVQYAYNGSTYDRRRNNTEGMLLASMTRTANSQSPQQTNYNARGVIIGFNVTAASGTGGVQLKVWGVDPVTDSSVVGQLAMLNSITTTGYRTLVVYPGCAGGGGVNANVTFAQCVLPRRWIIEIFHLDGSSYTYSVSYSYVL